LDIVDEDEKPSLTTYDETSFDLYSDMITKHRVRVFKKKHNALLSKIQDVQDEIERSDKRTEELRKVQKKLDKEKTFNL